MPKINEAAYDDAHPVNWTLSKRWRVTLISCYITLIVGMNSTSITTAARDINERFGVSDDAFPNSYWPVTAWNGGAALAPMLAIPLLEKYGIRKGYLTSYILFTLFVFPQAFAENFATLVVCRFISGCFAGILQDVMDGIIADIWPSAKERSLPVTCYVLCLLLGVTLGPVFGGAVVSRLGWRWMFYIQLIIYGVSLPILLVLFEETRAHIITGQAETQASEPESEGDPEKTTPESTLRLLYEAVALPSRLLVTEPVVLFFTLLSALSYGLVFVSTQSVTQVFSELYSWTDWEAGLVQSSIAIGEVVGFLACIPQNMAFARKVEANKDRPALETTVPEGRLYLSIPGSFIGLAGGLFWYGWTSYPFLPWVLPAIGLGLTGFGVMTVMQAIMIYITDSYDQYAGSASAAVCFGENAFAAFLPLSASAMYTDLGFQWASSLLALIALALSFAPVVIFMKGKQIRGRSPFMRKAAAPSV